MCFFFYDIIEERRTYSEGLRTLTPFPLKKTLLKASSRFTKKSLKSYNCYDSENLIHPRIPNYGLSLKDSRTVLHLEISNNK